MSFKEFELLTAGVTLTSDCKTTSKSNTSSNGFCFFGNDTGYKPERFYEFMSGIVSRDLFVKFEIDNYTVLKKGWGRYANPDTMDWDDFITVNEYSIKEYDRELIKPVGYSYPSTSRSDIKWYNVN
jgi:hypothetical protein